MVNARGSMTNTGTENHHAPPAEPLATHGRQTTLSIFCDGGARGNPGPAAVAFVVKNDEGQTIKEHAQTIGDTTNNIAEYKAVIAALRWIAETNTQESLNRYHLFLDSRLVVNQLKRNFKIKNAKLKKLAIEVKRLEQEIAPQTASPGQLFAINTTSVTYALIPREKNVEADTLVNTALDRLLPR